MRGWLLVAALSHTAFAAPRRAVSGPLRASLLELYTSEGCSSCPPADDFVNGLAARFGDRVLPLAFHVDYWDEIGWPDPFARHEWAVRQRERSPAGLYTPELLLDGHEIRARQLAPATESATVQIELELDGNRATVLASGGKWMYLALTESNLVVDVKAGENRGRRLRHDHVVRVLHGPFPVGKTATVELLPGRDWKVPDLAVTAFVEGPGGQILQALRLPFRSP
jgi:hypothetical protein